MNLDKNCEKLTFQNSKMKKGFEDFQRLNLDQLGEIIVRDLCEDYYREFDWVEIFLRNKNSNFIIK